MRSRRMIAVALAFALTCSSHPAFAAWPHPSTQNLPVSSGVNPLQPLAVSDGAGGIIVAWYEYRGATDYDIVAQRVSASGALLWAPSGVVVCDNVATQTLKDMVPDRNGGAIMIWTDTRNAGTSPDLFAGRVTAAGTVPWGTGGVPVCQAAGTQYDVVLHQGADPAGDAIAAWSDERGGASADDIYVQRITTSGAPQFAADGALICNAANAQFAPSLEIDPNGYFYTAWTDGRGANLDIYIQRSNLALGTSTFAANGIVVCNAAGDQGGSTMASDGVGGAVVAWTDQRSGTADIYAQYVSTAGSIFWAANGVGVCTAANSQFFLRIAPIGSGATVMAWEDYRAGTGYADIYAQRVNGYGAGEWGVDGLKVIGANGGQSGIAMGVDGMGNTLIAWRDYRDNPINADLYAQRIASNGTLSWAGPGVPVATATGAQILEHNALVLDGAGGCTVAFQDNRVVAARVYAQHVDTFGILGGEPVLADVSDVPNDQGGRVTVSWNASPLDTDPLFLSIAEYRLYRSVPPGVAEEMLRGGTARLEGEPGVGRELVTTVTGATTYFWEYVGQATAEHLATYSLLAATTGDSIGGSNPTTAFMVRARNADGSQWWDSQPDSGYSVDDLAPATPAPFTGEYASGATRLHWNPNTESDLVEYRLYRGSTKDFTPGPGSFVAAPPDTGYTDPAGAPFYYKLAAVDIHGNVSPYAVLTPSGTVDAPAFGGRALRLFPPMPNPARAGADLRFSLGAPGRARLAVLDVGGRCVRVLADGMLAAGPQAIRWDGRDARGGPVAPGLYFVRLEAEGRGLVARMAVAR